MGRRLVRQWGYTLIEILVVIGIIVILLGITVPIAMRLTAGHRAMGCESNLSKIYQALRLYRMDEGGFPPYVWDNTSGVIEGRGLLALLDLGYLKSPAILRCPMDAGEFAPGMAPEDLGSLAFRYGNEDPVSYQWIDPDARVVGPEPPFRYLTSRTLMAPPDPDSTRIPYAGRGSSWQPDDTTVITWCPLHRKTLTEGGKGQYLVLFWNGRIARMDADLFRNCDPSTTPPEEAWRVMPFQRGWNNGLKEF
ncbi:MAG: prepilin-type N-terminal cleavage/methylation domain-containing protein [Candidatus Zipacnadales bacterium]